MEDEIYTVQEVAEKLKITRKGVYDLMRDGRLAYVQIGLRQRRITGAALRAFLKSGQRGDALPGVQPDDIQMPGHAARTLVTA